MIERKNSSQNNDKMRKNIIEWWNNHNCDSKIKKIKEAKDFLKKDQQEMISGWENNELIQRLKIDDFSIPDANKKSNSDTISYLKSEKKFKDDDIKNLSNFRSKIIEDAFISLDRAANMSTFINQLVCFLKDSNDEKGAVVALLKYYKNPDKRFPLKIEKLEEICDLVGCEKNHEKLLEYCNKLDLENCANTNNQTELYTEILWNCFFTNKIEISDESPNVIFYGAPGTGKTYAVKNYLDFNGIEELPETDDKDFNPFGYYRWVQFHPSFTYEDFVEGLKPTGVTNAGVKLELVNGVFKDFCKRALNGIRKTPDEDVPYYFIVDEINRANLSTVFGETLSLLEPSYRDKVVDKKNGIIRNLIDTQYSALERNLENEAKKKIAYDSDRQDGKFGVPRNVRFIGMMNDVDKSIDAFDLALRRRFKWIPKDCDYVAIESKIASERDLDSGELEKYLDSCKALNTFISEALNLGKSYEFGHSFFMKITEFAKQTISDDHKKSLFNRYLRPTLKEYLRSEVNDEKSLESKLNEALKKFIGEPKKGNGNNSNKKEGESVEGKND